MKYATVHNNRRSCSSCLLLDRKHKRNVNMKNGPEDVPDDTGENSPEDSGDPGSGEIYYDSDGYTHDDGCTED